jgi:Tol biopolymer transport system component/C-terminal processing protease CtpA/Prc
MKKILLGIAMAGPGLLASAATPLWLRDVQISPSGNEILFTYKGDIYKVAATGGKGERLTTQPSYESMPIWSPDGTKVAFASDRSGATDIYVMNADGSNQHRLTTNSASEIPQSFTPDGEYVLFSAMIQDDPASILFPSRRLTELYQVPVAGGATTQVLTTPAIDINFIAGTTSFLYNDVKGMESEWRKHHTSSVTRDIWLYDGKSHRNLTNRGGEDIDPVASPDGKRVYLLSERNGGSMNLYTFPLDNPSDVKALTEFTTHPLRFLSGANNGTLAFTYDGEIYTLRDGGTPKKVAIDIETEDEELPEVTRFSSGAGDAVPSPDGTQVAFTHRGDIFVTSVEYNTTKQITSTPQGESHPTWGDNRTLYYTSDRSGHNDIYRAKIKRAEDPNFPNATLIEEEALFTYDGIERDHAILSPDGKSLAFVQDRRNIAVMDLATKKVKLLTRGETYTSREGDITVEWSPDSEWLTTFVDVHQRDPYYDIAVINVASGELTNITNSAYMNLTPHWVMNGDAIVFISERYGMKNHASWGSSVDVLMVFTNQAAYDRYKLGEEDFALLKEAEKAAKNDADKDKDKEKKDKKSKKTKNEETPKAKSKVEVAGIEDRIVRLTPFSSNICDAYVDNDGESLYFLAETEDGYDLWKKDLRKGDISIANKLGTEASALIPDGEGKNLFIMGSNGSLKKLDLGKDKVTALRYSGTQKINHGEEREYMFDYILQQEAQRFYRTDMHGVDWNAMGEAYRKFLPHINNNYDFAELGSELLGELNVSHTGAYYMPEQGSPEATATLGLLYDMRHEGNGLVVEEIVQKSPFDNATTKMTRGATITAINGIEITPEADLSAALNGTIGKKTLVAFTTPSGEKVEEVVRPISSSRQNTLLYDRWVRRNEQIVDSLSNGRLGYVHLQTMSDGSYRNIYAEVLGKYNERDGIVIDTRWNGGGRLHEDIEVLFSGDKYLTQEIRDVVSGQMPSRRWNKPSIMVIGEANYSNAHGTPWVYKNRNLGKLVGMPVPGTMSSVNWVSLQDDTMYFGIPVVGFKTAEGYYLENHQLEPDVKVANSPEDAAAGIDNQLRVAVETLLRDIDQPR